MERQPELLLAVPTDAAIANISGATVDGTLGIDNWVWNNKKRYLWANRENKQH